MSGSAFTNSGTEDPYQNRDKTPWLAGEGAMDCIGAMMPRNGPGVKRDSAVQKSSSVSNLLSISSRFAAETEKQHTVGKQNRRVVGRHESRRRPRNAVYKRSRKWPEERRGKIACGVSGDIAHDVQQPCAEKPRGGFFRTSRRKEKATNQTTKLCVRL